MEEWKKVKLGEVCDFIAGFAFKANDFGNYSSKVIKIGDINPPYVNFATMIGVDMSNYDREKLQRYEVCYDDFVLAMTGATIGKVGRYIEKTPAYLNQRVLLFRPFAAQNKYIYHLVCSESFHKYVINHIDSESAQPNISAATIGKYEFYLPPLSIQERIANILSSLDDKLECNRRINDNLEQQAIDLFDYMFPSITTGNYKIGDWLKPKRGIGLLTKDTILGDVPVVAGGLRPAAYHNKANTLSPVVTISASGANAGYVALWNKPVWSSDSSYIDPSLTPDVYFWYVMLKKRQKEIFDAQTGSAQPHIYPQHIAELPIKQLENEQIIKYTEQVTPLFKMIGDTTEENVKLAQLRDTLLPKLMSGELKIS